MQIDLVPIVMKDARIKVGADNYEKAVRVARLVPTANQDTKTFQGLTPSASFTDTSTPAISWELQLEYAQDWETANSLSSYLLTNSGTQKSIVLQPKAGAGKKTFTITATIVPGPIGGQVNEYADASVSLPCTGQPLPASDGVA